MNRPTFLVCPVRARLATLSGLCAGLAIAAACSEVPSEPATEAHDHGQLAVVTAPLWDNGDFEASAIGATPPGGWTLATYTNSAGVSGTATTPPTSFAALNLGTPGTSKVETFVVGGTVGSQSDPDLGSGQSFRFPLYGSRAARVNYASATDNGKNKNANAITQTMTVAAGDVDPVDGQIHVRFAVAPVLENPSHGWNQQPYYYIELQNLTQGTTLYREFDVAGQVGVPWKTTRSLVTGNATLWLDWKLVDIAPVAGSLAIGDQVKLTVVASGCSLGGHFGRVYVDGLGATVPGPYTYARADQASVTAGSALTYTFHYANGGDGTVVGSHVDFNTPPGTTYKSIAPPAGITCATPAVGAAGLVSCPLGALPAGASGAFTVTVDVLASATGPIVNGNYSIAGVNAPTLIGATVSTPVLGAPPAASVADVSVSMSTHQALSWGETGVTWTLTVSNTSSNALNVQTTWTAPPELTNVTWCRLRSNGGCSSQNGTSGTGNLTHLQSFSSGQTRSYRISANIKSGSGPGSLTHLAAAKASGAFVDSNPANNSVTVVETLGTTTPTLAVTKAGGAASGTISSSPTGILLDTTQTSASWRFGAGTSVTLRATPSFGFVVSGWSAQGVSCGAASTCTIVMSGSGTTNVTTTFAVAPAPAPAAIWTYSGNGQRARTGTSYASPLAALVTDASGNPVSGASVTFTNVVASGASVGLGPSAQASVVATTDAFGIARVAAAADAVAGPVHVEASLAGVSQVAAFQLVNVGAPASMVYVQGGRAPDINQAPVGGSFGAPLMVLVTDAAQSPVPGVSVAFAVPGSGASGVLASASATTDADGLAAVGVRADSRAGAWTATASSGSLAPVAFALENVAAGPAALYLVSGSPQAAAADPATAFMQPLVVVVADAVGNPVPNATVTFAAPASGPSASLSSTTATTDAFGEARVDATSGATIGSYDVTAHAAGVAAPVRFRLTNLGSDTITLIDGDRQQTAAGSAFAKGLTVQVLGSDGSPVATTVTFSVPSSGPSATLATNEIATDAEGFATSPIPVAGSSAGAFVVTASAPSAGLVEFALTSRAGPAASVAVVSGSGQVASVDAAFAAPLVARVTDAFANPVEGVSVSFVAPSSGASVSLGSAPVTDADGKTAVSASANDVGGAFEVVASAVGASGVARFALENQAAVVTTRALTLIGGTPQSSVAGTLFGSPLAVAVVDHLGRPVPDVAVTFTGPATGARADLPLGTIATGEDGVASTAAVAGSELGDYDVVATADGTEGTIIFRLTNLVGPPATLVAVSGNGQSTAASSAFGAPLVVVARDILGHPVPGVVVSFTLPDSGPSVSVRVAPQPTDVDGQAQVSLQAGTAAGSVRVLAACAEVSDSVTFKLAITAGAPAAIAVASGAGQVAPVGEAFAAPLVARVIDLWGNPVAGASVTFSAPASAATASVSPTVVVSDAAGLAAVDAQASETVGSYLVDATTPGARSPARFGLGNAPGPAASIRTVSGSRQSVPVGQAFAQPLVASVSDRFGNAVPGAVVTYAAPANGASAQLASDVAISDAIGRASIAASAGQAVGLYNVAATTPGVGEAATFALTNLVGAPAKIERVSGDGQAAVVDAAFAAPLVVRVSDRFDNPVPDAVVTATAPSAGPSAVVVAAPRTGSDGASAITVRAGTVAGDYAVEVGASGAGSVRFDAQNLAGPAASVSLIAGDRQSARVGTAFAAPVVFAVRDAFDNAVAGASLSLHESTGGVVLRLGAERGTSDDDGQVAVAVAAGEVVGTSSIEARLAGVGEAAVANLSTTAGEPVRLVRVAGDDQVTRVAEAFGERVVVRVTDAHGNVLSGVAVIFEAAGADAATVESAQVESDGSGFAATAVTAPTRAGICPVTARIAGSDAAPAVFHLVAEAGPAVHISADPLAAEQATEIGQPFARALAVRVSDAYGNPVADEAVRFGVPSTGPSAIFDEAVVTTDADGVAATRARANAQAGVFVAHADIDGANALAYFTLTNLPGAPAVIVAESGTPATAVVGTELAAPLVAVVRDAFGNAVPGVRVSFTAPGVGPSATLSAPTSRTDAAGRVVVTARAGTRAGRYTLRASADGAMTPALFEVENLAGRAAALVVTGGGEQRAEVGTAFRQPLAVSVRDAYDNPVPGAVVVWSVPTLGATASLDRAKLPSDEVGGARVFATAGSIAGAYLVSATVAGIGEPALFELGNLTGPPATLELGGSGKLTTTVATAFDEPLAVIVRDGYGNPVAGAEVHFSASHAAASASFDARAETDRDGRATVAAFANTVSGSYEVKATVADAAAPVLFTLRNVADAPARVRAVDGTPQVATVATAFVAPLVAAVSDRFGNPVPDVAVTFAAPEVGASAILGATRAVSDERGFAHVAALAGPHAGAYRVVGRVDEVGAASFRLTNTAGAPHSLGLVSGAGQRVSALEAAADPIVVALRDSYGNPVAGQPVAVDVGASGIGVEVVDQTTDALGQATLAITAGAITGRQSLTVSADGAALPLRVEIEVEAIATRARLAAPLALDEGEPATLVAELASDREVAWVGVVEFRLGAQVLGTASLDETGRATLAGVVLPVGRHEVGAYFGALDPLAASEAHATITVRARVEVDETSDFYAAGGAGCGVGGPGFPDLGLLFGLGIVALVAVRGARSTRRGEP